MGSGRRISIDGRVFVALVSAAVALLVACVVLASRGTPAGGSVFFGEEALRNPDIQREVIRKLVEQHVMPFDSHPDPEVARVLIPSVERDQFRTNAIGMRERDFQLEKPDGAVRIVLLGDSYVFGLNIAADARLGARLEHMLAERAADPAPRFECLHFAVNSWSLVSECAFLRRQLELLRPDLVIQVSLANDLDDVTGVRGFGTEATFAPASGERADSLILSRYPKLTLQRDIGNLLSLGLDHEGRERFAAALRSVQALRTAMAALPGKPAHLLVFHWGPQNAIAHTHLGAELEPASVLYLPLAFSVDKTTWLSPSDAHWNERGHEQVARILYGVIRERGLLPGVELAPWPEAEDGARAWARSGLDEVEAGDDRLRNFLGTMLASIDFAELDDAEARQIHGGVDLEGLASPYVSFMLARPAAARELVLRGRCLPDEALRGARVEVHLEELALGGWTLEPDREIEFRAAIPAELDGRELLNVRTSAADFVYRGENLRHCVAFRIDSAALE